MDRREKVLFYSSYPCIKSLKNQSTSIIQCIKRSAGLFLLHAIQLLEKSSANRTHAPIHPNRNLASPIIPGETHSMRNFPRPRRNRRAGENHYAALTAGNFIKRFLRLAPTISAPPPRQDKCYTHGKARARAAPR